MLNFFKSLRQKRRERRLATEAPEEIFSRYYRRNTWGDRESASGKGSNLEVTEALRAALPCLLSELGVTSLLDVPCGDFNWMSHVDLEGIDYIGGDIVPELVAANRKYEGPGRHFQVINLIETPLPKVEMIFTRDCLVHLSHADALRALRNIKASGATYLMATTFPGTQENSDILTGQWRPLNLRNAPFGFPEPTHMIDERFMGKAGRHSDKSMGVWVVTDLPDL